MDMPEGPAAVEAEAEDDDEGGINPAKAQAWRSEESILEYTSKDTILYAWHWCWTKQRSM